MYIVDSQIHVWDQDHPEAIPRHGDRPLRAADVLAEMRAAGVDRAVLVPPYWVGSDNSVALQAAAQHPDKFAVMGRIDMASPDADRAQRWREQPHMLGIRLLFNTPEALPGLELPQGDWLWETAAATGLPLMIHAPGRLDAVARLARRFPRLRLAIDHLGIGRAARDEAAFAHIEQLLALAPLPNVCVKLSTVPIFSSQAYPYPGLHPFLHRIHQGFGSHRLFWGSDLSRLPCSYRLCVNLVLEELPWLTAQDREWIMGRALCDWLSWPAGPRPITEAAPRAPSPAR